MNKLSRHKKAPVARTARALGNVETREGNNVMSNATAIPKENNVQLGTVEFLGKPLTVMTTDSQLLVAMRPICEGVGLDWKSQYERIKRDEVLSTSMVVMTTQMPGDDQKRQITCLPLNLLNGWLFGVDSKRCKPFVRQALVRYKFECYDALAAYWQQRSAKALPEPKALPVTDQLNRFDHSFQGRRVEFLVGGGQVWCKASAICTALGLGSSDRITRGLPDGNKLARLRGRQRHIYIDAAAAQRAGDYVRDADKAKAWADWISRVLGDLVRAPLDAGSACLDERTQACLYALCEAGDRLVRAHHELAPVHQAMRSNALIGVGAALEALQVGARHLRAEHGEGMLAAAQRSGLVDAASPNLLGVQLSAALGRPALVGDLQPLPETRPLQGELIADEELTPVQRLGMNALLDTRLIVAFDHAGQLQIRPVTPDAVVVPLNKLPAIVADPFALPAGQLPDLLEAVTARMKALVSAA